MKEQEVTSKVSLEALGSLLLVEAPHSMSKLASESANPKYSPNQTIEVWRVSYYCSFHTLQPPSTHNLCNDCLLLSSSLHSFLVYIHMKFPVHLLPFMIWQSMLLSMHFCSGPCKSHLISILTMICSLSIWFTLIHVTDVAVDLELLLVDQVFLFLDR